MSPESQPNENAPALSKTPSLLFGQPIVTLLAAAACVAIHLLIATSEGPPSWEQFERFGYVRPTLVWEGRYWALISSTLVHVELWHVGFNLYWLWQLGTRLERAIGHLPFLALFLSSALVSSAFQLAISGSTGIGASGVVYAIFGFMWASRIRFPSFYEIVNDRLVKMFVYWLFACIALTYLDIMNIGNAAHASGLLFGFAASVFLADLGPRLRKFAGLAALTALAILSLFWAPWSLDWLAHDAVRLHKNNQFPEAIDRYSQVIAKDSENSWAYDNRGLVYLELLLMDEAGADRKRALAIDPTLESAASAGMWLAQYAYVAHSEGRTDEALTRYTQLLDKDPNDAWALRNRALILDALGKPKLAQEDRARAQEIDPKGDATE